MTNEQSGNPRIDICSLLDALDALDSADASSESDALSYRSNSHDGLTEIDSDHELGHSPCASPCAALTASMAGFARAEREAPTHRVGLACATPKRDTPAAEHLADRQK
jgi:hypothetical protein